MAPSCTIADMTIAHVPQETSRKQLRPYQARLKTEVVQHLTKSQPNAAGRREAVLALCPGGGKTLTSIAIADELLESGVARRALVLAHGTGLLRTQYSQDVEDYGLPFEEYVSRYHRDERRKLDHVPFGRLQERLVVSIPHTLDPVAKRSRDLERAGIDLVVVDEAHHYYLAKDGMAQRILEATGAKMVLLLTGTPSRFVYENEQARKDGKAEPYSLFLESQFSLLEQGYVADPLVEVATYSAFKIDERHYEGSEDEPRGYHPTSAQAQQTMRNVLAGIRKRLTLPNNPWTGLAGGMRRMQHALRQRQPDWCFVFEKVLQKTLVACPHSEQGGLNVADEVVRFFDRLGVGAVKCTEEDVENESIKKFKDPKGPSVLVVVDKGVLGFNFPGLVNVIDLKGGRTVDPISQLLHRVGRVHPDDADESGKRRPKTKHPKLYMKVMPAAMAAYTRALIQAVIQLGDEDMVRRWNGKAGVLGGVEVSDPTEPRKRCPKRKQHRAGVKCGTCGFTKCVELHVVGVKCPVCKRVRTEGGPGKDLDLTFFSTGEYMEAFKHRFNDTFALDAWTTLGRMREKLLTAVRHDVDGHIKEIESFFSEHNREPSQYASDPKEKALGNRLSKYRVNPSIEAKLMPLRKLGWLPTQERRQFENKFLIQWISNHAGKAPNSMSTDTTLHRGRTEREWGILFLARVRVRDRKGGDLRNEAFSAGWSGSVADKRAKLDEALLSWFNTHDRFPPKVASDKPGIDGFSERQLAHAFNDRRRSKHSNFMKRLSASGGFKPGFEKPEVKKIQKQNLLLGPKSQKKA